jgi:hypothetical protein
MTRSFVAGGIFEAVDVDVGAFVLTGVVGAAAAAAGTVLKRARLLNIADTERKTVVVDIFVRYSMFAES